MREAPQTTVLPAATGASRENNFGMMRLVGAFMVIVGHNAFITGSPLPTFFKQGIQGAGIQALFVIGGYMITTSWLNDPHPLRYAIKRVMRIVPPLFVLCVIMVFMLGPVVTSLPRREYFSNPGTYQYFSNAWMYVRYGLPGVFVDNPYPNVVNGSLWSLPLEMLNYLMVPLFLTLTRVKKDSGKSSQIAFLGVCILFWSAQVARLIWAPNLSYSLIVVNVSEVLSLCPYYFFGAALSLPQFKKYLNLQMAAVCMLIYACFSLNLGWVAGESIFMVLWPYTVLSIGTAQPAHFAKATQNREISYGLYLYGFPVQQTLVYLTLRAGLPVHPLVQLVLATCITAVFAYGSYRLVELPCQKLTKKILARVGKKTSTAAAG